MKKINKILLIGIILFGTVGCKQNEVKEENINQNNNTNNNTVETNKEITLEDVMNAPTSPESDFVCMEMKEGEALLVEYLGSSEIVVLPETWHGMKIVEVSQYMFNNDSPIKAIRLSNSVRRIGICAFSHNESLEFFVSGKGLEEIAEGAFQNCTNLKEVVLNDGLVTLGEACLSGSEHLTSIEIPASVTNIAKAAFYWVVDDFTIIGTKGSKAEEYANSEGIKFQAK